MVSFAAAASACEKAAQWQRALQLLKDAWSSQVTVDVALSAVDVFASFLLVPVCAIVILHAIGNLNYELYI